MLLRLLEQVRDRELLAGNNYCPREIGARLGADSAKVELAMVEAERRGLVTLERRWIGSWRRVVLTDAGRKLL